MERDNPTKPSFSLPKFRGKESIKLNMTICQSLDDKAIATK